jgi:hypothetical protein
MTEHADIERIREESGAEYRSLTDVALLAGPPLGAATAWALSKYGPGSHPEPSQAEEPQVILPPGVDPDQS